jgi:hypothetical protein
VAGRRGLSSSTIQRWQPPAKRPKAAKAKPATAVKVATEPSLEAGAADTSPADPFAAFVTDRSRALGYDLRVENERLRADNAVLRAAVSVLSRGIA